MIDNPGRRRVLLAAAAVLPAACAGPAFLPPPVAAVPTPRVRVGDRWRYRLVNRYNNLATGDVTAQVSAITPNLTVALTRSDGQPAGQEVYDYAWRIRTENTFDAVQTFDVATPVVPARIEAGAHEAIRTYFSVPEVSRRMDWTIHLSAPGWERVRVPAGEFDCLRIERHIRFTHSDVFRTLSQRFDTLWYAPNVNRWVLREWTGEYVLPGGRRSVIVKEDWVRWELLDYVPAPVA